MVRKSNIHFRAGLLLLVVGTMFSLPYLLALFGDPLELGDAWASPLGMTLSTLAILAGVALIVSGLWHRRAERARKKAGAERAPAPPREPTDATGATG